MSNQRPYQIKRDCLSSLFLSDGRLDYRTRERFDSEVFLDAAEAGTVHFAVTGEDPDCQLGVMLDDTAAEELGEALLEAAESAREGDDD